MKICLTGSSGFIGQALLRGLLAYNYQISLINNQTQLSLPTGAALNLIQSDLLSPSGRQKAIDQAKADVLIHLAWYAEPGLYWRSPLNLDWLLASLDLIKLFAAKGGRRLIIMGTCAEYDWSLGGSFHEYSSLIAPRTFYGQAKDSLRRAMEGYAAISSLSTLWCRLFWPYGPGEAADRLLTSLAKTLMANQPAVCRAGNLRRDYLFVEDVATALVSAVNSPIEGILNIGSGESVLLGDLSIKLADLLEKKHLLTVESVPITKDNPLEIKANVKRLQDELNWRPLYSIEKGIESLLNYLCV